MRFGLVLIVLFAAGCVSGRPVFEFASGGVNHPSGFGEWRIKLDAAGKLSIAHDVQGAVKDYGPYTLSEKENAELWALIRAADVAGLKPATRLPVPGEVAYTFTLNESGRPRTAQVWINDAGENAPLMALVERIGALIEQYTQTKPVLQ
jgi:hypothetical protein